MPPMKMVHSVDPAKEIWQNVGDLSKFKLAGNQVLVGIYLRPDKTQSGLYLAQTTRDEDMHQGKSGLCLLKGPSAFVSDTNYDFNDFDVEIGEWIASWVSDGRKIIIGKQLCRILEDHHVRLKIPTPDSVF
jgi:hypothetical protein